MLSSLRKCHQSSGVQGLRIGLIFSAAAALAGCSADISRFDLGNPEGARAHSDYAPSGGATGRSASSEFGSAGYDRPSYRGNTVARSELPPTPQAPLTTSAIPPQQQQAPYGGYGQQQRQPSYGSDQRAPQYNAQPSPSYSGGSQYGGAAPSGQVAPIASRDAGGAKGDMIEVRPGDTLYGISRRHKVSLNELMTTNGLTSPNLKPGQQLYLPAGTRAAASETARPAREDRYHTSAAAEPAQSAPTAEAPSDWNGSYTVRSGDSLYAIARQNNVKLAELERYNGIQDSRKVKPGTVLKIPGGAAPAASQVADAAPAAEAQPYREQAQTPAPAPGAVRLGEATSPPPTSSSQQPMLLNGSNTPAPPAAAPNVERVAKAETPGAASDAVTPAASQNAGSVAGSRLRWPVAGKVISGFGPRPDGTHNDGVNLAAPMGTDIHAAENGVVAYSGDELKGYGNLVLIRHDNGWVTAYAHADEILVKRGDRIKRGQVIAKAGRTGQVDQPQVHFELRQGQKPVDPTPFMERL
jgi:murein DD-endopeptidase MepM/ murein hydrolase activator NlpD